MSKPSPGTLLDIMDYQLRLSRSLSPRETSELRGFFGQAFADEVLLHHHNPDGSLHYAYPRVQFKVLDRTAHLLGFAEGCGVVMRLWAEADQARIGTEEMPILEAGLTRRRQTLGETVEPIAYRFRTPWLALNQDNYRDYQRLNSQGERQARLERVLVGNCLALATSFGHRVSAPLTADASKLQPRTTRLKGVEMLGFVGICRINFQLPDHIGIGKSVSRGFGTVDRLKENEEGRSC
jgi:hypothetical protein